MSILSDGKFISPLHRVLSQMKNDNNIEEDERMSFVFFFYANYNAKIPKPKKTKQNKYSLLKDQSSKKTKNDLLTIDKKITFGSYIKQKWKQVTRDSY